MFSKSFGYALRGVLYIALYQDEKRMIQLDEIASNLAVPRHFMGKILKNLVKHGILYSVKGPHGGFYINERTLVTPIIEIAIITDGDHYFKNCVLRLSECNTQNPCPLHHQVSPFRQLLQDQLTSTNIGDLLKDDKADFLQSIRNLQAIPS